MKKISVILLAATILFMFGTACETQDNFVDKSYEEETNINNLPTIPEPTEPLNNVTANYVNEDVISEQAGYNIDLPLNYKAYAAEIPFPFLLDEIKNMFNDNKDLFEKIKDIGEDFEDNSEFIFDGLRESMESPYKIYVSNISLDYFQDIEIDESSKYEPIIEFFNYTDFTGIYHGGFHSISLSNNLDYPEFGKYLSILTRSPFFVYIRYYYDYEPEEITEDGDLHIKLDDNWYYFYRNSLRPPT